LGDNGSAHRADKEFGYKQNKCNGQLQAADRKVRIVFCAQAGSLRQVNMRSNLDNKNADNNRDQGKPVNQLQELHQLILSAS